MPYHALKRRPLGGLSEFRRFLYNAFILPWRSPKLAYLYSASLLFAFSFSFLDLFIVIDLIELSAWDMAAYLISKSVGVSALVSLLFIMITRHGGRVIYPVMTAMMMGALMYAIMDQNGLTALELGIIFALTNSSFWALYHVFFAISISNENVGNEVSLAGTGMTLGMAIGYFCGGLFQALSFETLGMMIGFGGMVIATFMLIIHAYRLRLKRLLRQSGALDETLKEAFLRCKYRSLGAPFDAAMQIGGGTLWLAYLSLSGIGAIAVGIWSTLMVLVKIIFTPIAGSLINHGKRREMLMGSAVTSIGWLPFIFTPVLALPAMYIWSVGNQLFQSGLNSAWYQTRTVSSLLAREIILGSARLILTPLMVWLLYTDANYFIYFMLGAAILMVLYSLYWMRNIKIKGPGMPIETLVARR